MMMCSSLILLNTDFVSTPKTFASKFIANYDFALVVAVVIVVL